MSVPSDLFDRFLDLLNLLSRTTRKMHPLLTLLFSWRTLFFLLAIANLKNVPWSWHVRLFSGTFRHGRNPAMVRKRLREAAAALKDHTGDPAIKPLHPVFRPVTYSTYAPMSECDYNIHKSNSTYFSDLDISRGNLVAALISPALSQNALVPHGIRKGLTYPILGSVHTSFLREVKPYEAYDVRSRVLGWDKKWIVIGSWFVRRASKSEIKKDKESGKDFLKGPVGKEEVVFAYVLNKYVVKAGRVTVPPELALAVSGWFPVRPELAASMQKFQSQSGSSPTNKSLAAVADSQPNSTGTSTPALGPDKAVDATANAINNVAIEAGRRLSLSASTRPSIADTEDEDMPGWSWDEIDAERMHGLKIAEMWLGLDVRLREQYIDEMDRGITEELERK